MICFKCDTHFCYLCGAFLDRGNPYAHYNTIKSSCYMRLWELEAGDDGEIGQGFNGGNEAWESDEDDDDEEMIQGAVHAAPAALPAPQAQIEIVYEPVQPELPRGGGNARGRDRVVNDAHRRNEGLQRFIRMAENDEEDFWDSDDLDDDAEFD